MVHVLREAHRVLRPGGFVVDLRPTAKRRRVGLGTGRRWRQVGLTRETFEKDHAADRAVAEMLRADLFRPGTRAEFMVDREMDAMEDFLDWLTEFGQRRSLGSNKWLIARLRRRLAAQEATIVVRGPVRLRLLHKAD